MRSALLALLLLLAGPALASDIKVTDGDTVRTAKNGSVRLVGLNAPETGSRALCPAERRLGLIAKARLHSLVDRGRASLRIVQCSCRTGTHGTMACNYGRRCGVLRINGRDAAEIMIAEGLAVPYVCGRTSCPKLPQPWCGP